MKEKENIGKQLMNTILESIKHEKQIGVFAYDWLKEIIEISFLNDFKDLMKDALNMRNSKKKHRDIYPVTNINYVLPIDKIELEKKYSYDKVLDFLKMIENSKEAYLYIKNPKELEETIPKAKDDFDLEIIACSLILNGEFDSATKILKNELLGFEYRISVVKTVMCIEYFRRNEIHKGKVILNEIYPKKDDCWGNLSLAKGILGYEPWGGYPNSDY